MPSGAGTRRRQCPPATPRRIGARVARSRRHACRSRPQTPPRRSKLYRAARFRQQPSLDAGKALGQYQYAMTKQFAGELISEAVAMIIIIAFGDSVAAMYGLYDPSPYQHAYWGVCISWGLAVTIAIYTTGSVSGCHANPAVTLALALYRKFSWAKVLPYCVAQTVGAVAGSVIVYQLYRPVIDGWNVAH